MRTLIIDDEPKSRETLLTLVQNYCEGITVAGTAANITDAAGLIETVSPQLVFLDISMPGGTGFDLLKALPLINFEVIFVTAYDKYGIEAIRANALDYLLKPVSIEELKDAVAKARLRIEQKQTAGNISSLLKLVDEKINQPYKVSIPVGDGLIFVSTTDIVCLVADGSYTRLMLKDNRKLLSSRNLKEYEDILPSSGFIRVHHSNIINIEHVRQYHRGEGGHVVMTDGTEVMISKRKKKDFLDRFIS